MRSGGEIVASLRFVRWLMTLSKRPVVVAIAACFRSWPRGGAFEHVFDRRARGGHTGIGLKTRGEVAGGLAVTDVGQ